MTHSYVKNLVYQLPIRILCIVLCASSPILALILSLVSYLGKFKSWNIFIISPIFYISFILSLLNSEKVVEGDLISYINNFQQLQNLSLAEVLSLYKREPLFYFLAWNFGHIFSFSDFTFKFCFSFIGFYLLLFACKKIMFELKYSKNQIFLGVLLVALSTTIFANSMHLTRQFLSLGFFLWAFSAKNIFWRNLGFLFAAITHISSVILIAFYFLTIAKKLSKFFFLLALIFYKNLISVTIFLVIPLGIGPLIYFAQRISSQSFHQMPGLSVTAIIFLVATIMYMILILFMNYNSYLQDNRQNMPQSLKQFYHLNIYLGFTVLFVQFVLGFNEPAARYMFSYVTLTMFSIAFSLRFLRVNSVILCTGSIILFFNFGLNLIYGTWTYNNVNEVVGCYLLCRNL